MVILYACFFLRKKSSLKQNHEERTGTIYQLDLVDVEPVEVRKVYQQFQQYSYAVSRALFLYLLPCSYFYLLIT